MCQVRDRSLFLAWGERRILGGSFDFQENKRGDHLEMTALKGRINSPLLLNLHVNEVPTLLENECVNPFILPNGKKLCCLMYADHLIILLQTAAGLHNSFIHSSE